METVKDKKILFLVTQSEMGGAQRYIYEVSKALAEKYEILVAAGEGDGELFRKIRSTKSEIRNIELKYLKRAPNPFLVFQAIAEITGLLKKESPDVLFLCSTTAGLLGSIAAFFCRFRVSDFRLQVIYRIGGWAFRDPRPKWKNAIIFGLEKLTAPLKDIIVVNSEYDWRIAVEKKIASPEKIVKIYNGIDIDSLDFFPKEKAKTDLALLDTGKVVGCVANFYKTKGLKYLIEAADILNNKYKIQNTKYLIVGEGRLRPQLEAQVKKLGLESKVILAGRIPDAYRYFKAFDVFVLPSLKEGFPWVILEAVAAELPVIATEVGALPEIIENGREGLLIEPKNSQALAEKIKWALEHPQEAKISAIQTKAKIVQKFSLQRMIGETEKLL